jgi:hypothetical protein
MLVHQELFFVPFDLYPPHDLIVFHVHANLLIVLGVHDFAIVLGLSLNNILIVVIWIVLFTLGLRCAPVLSLSVVVFYVHYIVVSGAPVVVSSHHWATPPPSVIALILLKLWRVVVLVVEVEWVAVLGGTRVRSIRTAFTVLRILPPAFR